MFEEIIVVEGNHDIQKIKSIYPNVDLIATNGSEISKETLALIKEANDARGVILFLDPDFPGEKIRKTIVNYIGNCKHAYVLKHQAISKNKRKVGIEHASKDVIIKALSNVLTPTKVTKKRITIHDLYALGLLGKPESKLKREYLGTTLNIGHNNGKSLCSKLNYFGFEKNDIKTILENDR